MGNTDLSPGVEFAENPDPRCACVLLLDTSGSMDGERIKRLNNGLQTSKTQLLEDHMAVKRVDLAIISFDSEVTVVRDFGPLDDFEPPVLTAQYQTFMGTAISEALDKIDDRKTEYKENGIQYYRPGCFSSLMVILRVRNWAWSRKPSCGCASNKMANMSRYFPWLLGMALILPN